MCSGTGATTADRIKLVAAGSTCAGSAVSGGGAYTLLTSGTTISVTLGKGLCVGGWLVGWLVCYRWVVGSIGVVRVSIGVVGVVIVVLFLLLWIESRLVWFEFRLVWLVLLSLCFVCWCFYRCNCVGYCCPFGGGWCFDRGDQCFCSLH